MIETLLFRKAAQPDETTGWQRFRVTVLTLLVAFGWMPLQTATAQDTWTVEIAAVDYADEIYWEIINSSGNILGYGGRTFKFGQWHGDTPYAGQGQIYTHSFTVQPSDYPLEMWYTSDGAFDDNDAYVTVLCGSAQQAWGFIEGGALVGPIVSNLECVPGPANNDCVDAQPLTVQPEGQCLSGVVSGSNIYAWTNEALSCDPTTAYPAGEVWYSFNSGSSTVVTVSFPYFDFATLGVEIRENCTGGTIACEVGIAAVDFTSTVVPNTDYLIRVLSGGQDNGNPGWGEFDICLEGPTAPDNDLCANATPLTVDGAAISSTNVGATADGPDILCGGGDGSESDVQGDVWFSFVAPLNGDNVIIETFAGTNDDTQMQVLDGCGGVVLACNEDKPANYMSLIELGCSEGLVPGETYYVQVDGWAGTVGTFSIEARSATPGSALGCTNPAAINYDPCATTDDGSCELPVVSCGPDTYTHCYSHNADDRFYYSAMGGTDLFMVINSGEFESPWDDLYIYDGFSTLSNLLYTFSGVVEPGTIIHSTTGNLMVRVVSDEMVSCSSEGYAPFNYSIRCEPPAANASCANAEILLAATFPDDSSELGSLWFTENDNQTVCAGSQGRSLYYTFTVTEQNNYGVRVNPFQGADVVFEVLDGCSGTQIACVNDYAAGEEEAVILEALEVGTYIVRIHNESGVAEIESTGGFTVHLQIMPYDCAGIPGGTAYIDDCETCVGGTTGLEPCCPVDVVYSSVPATAGFANGSATVEVSSGSGPYTYSWNDPFMQTTATALGLFPGTYTCVVTGTDCSLEIDVNVSIQMDIPLTYVIASQCGNTGFALSDFLTAKTLIGADAYRWKFEVQGGVVLGEFTRYNSPHYRLQWVTGIELGTAYNVSVKARKDGQWGEYGDVCMISTASNVPQTELLSPYASLQGETYELCDIIIAQNINSAEDYRWSFDPNTGVQNDEVIYTRNSANPGVRLSWVNNLVPGQLYQVSVMVKVNGVWGMYGVQKPLQVAGVPSNVFIRDSYCGGTYGPNSVILSEGVCEADFYRFRLVPVGGGPAVYRTSNNYVLFFNGALANLAPGDYNLSVRVSQNGQVGDFGPDCLITIESPIAPEVEGPAAQRMIADKGEATLYPNPSTGTEVRVTLSGLTAGNHDVMITVYDLYGKQLNTHGFGHEGETLNRLVHFNQGLSTGVYMVQIVVDGEIHATERLVVN